MTPVVAKEIEKLAQHLYVPKLDLQVVRRFIRVLPARHAHEFVHC